MRTLANLLILVVGLDLEPELAAFDLEKLGADRDLLAFRRGAEVLDVDLKADGGVPFGQMRLYRFDACALHQSYHGGGGEHALSSHVLDDELVIDRRDDLPFKPWCETAFGHDFSPSVKLAAIFVPLAHAPDETAVDGNGRPGGIAPPRRDQQRHHGRDVIDGADAAHRDLGFQLGAHRAGIAAVGCEDLLKPSGLDVTGADGIDVDVVLGDLKAQRLGIADDAGPRGHRQAEASDGLNGRDRGDVENGPTPPLRDHVRNCGAGHADHVHQVLLDGLGPRRVIEADEVAQRWCAIVVDEDVNATGPRDRRLDDAGAVLGTAAIRDNWNDLGARLLPQLLGGLGQVRLAPRRDDKSGALERKCARNAVADAHAGATDDPHLAFEPEVHGSDLAPAADIRQEAL